MKKYAVIGHPAKHSLSPKIHLAFAEQTGIKIDYHILEPDLTQFMNSVKNFKQQGGNGLNVTLPFKQEAFQLADTLTDNAKLAEAVSCLAFKEDGSVLGDNYDGTGLVQDLLNNHDFNLQQKKILIVGAGGAVRGLLGPLLEKAPAEIIIANRTVNKAEQLAKQFEIKGPVKGVGLQSIPEMIFDLVIHATSLGYAKQLPQLPAFVFHPSTTCYDLSYGEAALPFLNFATQQNVKFTTDGLGMLVEHNAAAFYLWHGVYPATKNILQSLRESPSM